MLTDVAGIQVGHWTDEERITGCTAVLLPDGVVAAGEVRGGAPSTRGFSALQPGRGSGRTDAIVLSGGSALGLAACDGVAAWLREQGRGYETTAGVVVPIVAGMVLFDLRLGDATAYPDHAAGRAAAAAARPGAFPVGRVGAGVGATIDKWRGDEHRRPGGLGTATERQDQLVVSALVACNAWGGLRGEAPPHAVPEVVPSAVEHTTLAVVATNARLDKVGCLLACGQAHNGFARALEPVHTPADGDAAVVVATGEVDLGAPNLSAATVGLLAARAVERAIRAAVAAPGGP